MGALPLCPGVIGANYEGIQDYAWWAEAYLQLLRRSDAVFMVPRWEESSGARFEHAEADRLSIPVFYHLSELKTWLTGVGPSSVDNANDHITPYE